MPKIIENVKEKLLEEGKKILIEKSYKELNIRFIVKRCNIGIGTFYNYFSNKEELVNEIFRNDWEKTMKLINKLKFSNIPLKEKLYEIYLSMDDFITKYISIFYEIAMLNGYKKNHHSSKGYQSFANSIMDLIEYEKQNKNISSDLSSYKLANLIISNMIFLSKTKYMDFDELYNSLKI
ncbi:bacterial regulatory protein, tetR family [Clostridium acetireducens DSM 10703]|uniref:Bacterial regulatory protein, tetR family n=1 Tax=Clostridium acetireducens DSM 10703 TaxID=1121290 RepID=A0A1E8EX00_9CLOT|nr:TetR/AcrR family transcriptional regulator [Clostridium acetireducens]OFI05307.1 bacterial regulatory protein, tetR family [Clostridium acetireducens DSM 10703]